MRRNKFKTYNDGVVYFGKLEESYGEDGNALDKKEFLSRGKLYFSFRSIREQDLLKFDSDKNKITLKVETIFNKNIKSNDIVEYNNEFYSITHIDPSIKQDSIYIYLSNFEDELNEHIYIYKKIKQGPLKDDEIKLYKKVWANIKSSNYKSDKEKVENEKLDANLDKTVTIRYLKDLDTSINPKASIDYYIKYKEINYNITKIINKNELSELLEISIEGE